MSMESSIQYRFLEVIPTFNASHFPFYYVDIFTDPPLFETFLFFSFLFMTHKSPITYSNYVSFQFHERKLSIF